MNFIIFILSTIAITQILTKEPIFRWLRSIFNFKPFTCSNCMSVWVGFLLSFLFNPITPYFSWFIYGMISYTSNRLFNRVIYGQELTISDDY